MNIDGRLAYADMTLTKREAVIIFDALTCFKDSLDGFPIHPILEYENKGSENNEMLEDLALMFSGFINEK